VSQVVRNELVLGFGGERADGAYVLDISVFFGALAAYCLAAWTTNFPQHAPR
jgi:hypothetical protein